MNRAVGCLRVASVLILLAAIGCGGSGTSSGTGKGGSGGHLGTGGGAGTNGSAGSRGTAGGGGAKGQAGAGGSQTGAGGQAGAAVKCTVAGATCTSNAQCCTQVCDSTTLTCTSRLTTCGTAGSSCAVNTDCCNLQCDTARGVCASATSCTADGATCASSSTCCSGTCTGGKCQALNTTCLTAGNPCTAPSGGAGGCCSGLCKNGTCALGSSFCIQPGDVCARDLDCCGGFCSKATGATQGVCMDVSTTGTGQCTHDGVLCNGCGSCCSRNCGPWALSGVNVCQPGLGCKNHQQLLYQRQRVLWKQHKPGPLHAHFRRQRQHRRLLDEHREPGAGRDLPADRRRQRLLQRSERLHLRGLAQGAVLRLRHARAAALPRLGRVRRRRGGDLQRDRSQVLPPARPDLQHRRRVLRPQTVRPRFDRDASLPDHDAERRRDHCVPSGIGCTATGDCCTGLVCDKFDGETWTCGAPSTPPPADAGVCALYGQGCNANTPCCNGVQCTYSPTSSACNGQTGCTCYTPL